MNVNKNGEVDKGTAYYCLMKVATFSILSALVFFGVIWLGIWSGIEMIRLGAMAFFGVSVLVGFGAFLLMVPALLYSVFKRE